MRSDSMLWLGLAERDLERATAYIEAEEIG